MSLPRRRRARAHGRGQRRLTCLKILPVCCKNTSAELHKQRFGSGGRGRCIKYGLEWYTPSEFEALCGRASSKDWKRSIRFGGRSTQAVIDEGVPTPLRYTCAAYCEDHSAMGTFCLFTPSRLPSFFFIFTPSRWRRKRNEKDETEKKPMIKWDSDMENTHNTSNNSRLKEAWQTIAKELENKRDFYLLEAPDTSNDHTTMCKLQSRARASCSSWRSSTNSELQ